MCQFISWIEYKGKLYFLTKKELGTRQGKALIKELDKYYQVEITGHGAIRYYYGLERSWGLNKECENFSTPDNFPPIISKALKAGDFEGLGVAPEILTKPALAEYKKIKQTAWIEYEKIQRPAWVEYKKIQRPAWAEYEKTQQPAWAEYEKTQRPAWAEYEKIKQAAWAEYEKIERPALVGYEKIERPAWAEYEKIEQAAWVEYEKIKQAAFWKLATHLENRIDAWK